jgi:cytochrome c556
MKTIALCIAAAALTGVYFVPAQERSDVERKDSRSDFMARKLKCGQKMLADLSRRDLLSVQEDADLLEMICADLQWNVLQTPEYLERSATFRRTIAALSTAARDSKFDRARLEYADLLGQCFACHEYLRDRKKEVK